LQLKCQFRKQFTRRSEQDRIMPAALAMADAVEGLERQILLMVQATLDGNLSLRGDQAAFKGSYQDIIKAVNDPSLRKELSTT
jgi:methyl-accepting chemotaxis protein